ncbi:MAG: prepilin-type N-terminal cleavage/methylation domain-containing protein [Desulfobacula sp.]|uniref:PilW family protein n=1 Tax=Desulfobacula sp. TaxID=2593537 RepID=UPI001DE20953|nr:prepilin-type N-terminal cleavage/methylation domain-containing protein [Desulfobacula sp.]MBT3484624.1 prepilin-type N-terminal cleavage/methylation domain-containing protein [Desulfobacula sp.]MBT3803994.1 prepilin-type N-terminal cleavage/methylation domain-containing protein [Desulfobacula sp.]MBT4023609.1 prepilin-type N-terminal cleavage/methylation domain-containing protein [Desulfobacula sp.]MBT4197723.1 prepilin-type N-terminal cleavage/methylation domain-containing protein [Desulfo
MNPLKNKTGFTLFEVIVAVTILGIIMISFQQVLGQSLSTHKDTLEKLEQISHARFAMERIAFLIRQTGFIESPVQGEGPIETLVIEERSMDAYNNVTQAFVPDGVIDADKDSNTLVNDDTTNDPVDKISFSLDKTDPDNWKLVEVLPDYSTAVASDFMTQRILCENVSVFQVTRGSDAAKQQNLVKIKLELGDNTNQVSLTTRAIAGKMLIL